MGSESSSGVVEGVRRRQRSTVAAWAVVATAAASAVPALAQNAVSVYTGAGGTSTGPTNGSFSDPNSFAGGVAPLSGSTTEIDFGGSGASGYTATDNAGPFTLTEIQLNSSSSAMNVIAPFNASSLLTFVSNGTVTPTIVQNGSGAFNVATGIALGNALTVTGTGTGTGALTFAGPINGSSGLTLSTSAPVTFTGSNNYTGATAITGGVVTIAGSSTGNGTLSIGAAGAGAVLNINTTGTVRFGGSPVLGRVAGGAGAIVQTSGTVNMSSGSGYLEIGNGAANAYGSYLLAGGSLATSDSSGIRVGDSAGGTGVWMQTGGSLLANRYFAVGDSSSNAVATFTGGTATVAAGYRFLIGDSATTTAALNVGTEAGGTAVLTNQNATGFVITDGNLTTGSGTVNLDAGVINQSAGSINKGSTNAAAVATLNLDGGTLRAGANNLTLIASGLTAVNVFNGGVTVDTQANTSTIAANLTGTSGNGIYATTGGAGTIAVPAGAGGSGYIGAPAVTVTGGTGTGATGIANVVNGVVTGVTLTNPGQGYTVGDNLTFTFTGGGTTTAAPAYAYTLASADAAVNGTGGLTKVGSGTLILTGTNTYGGSTNITAGAVQLNSASSTVAGTLGAGPVNISAGASLNFNRTDTGLTVANPIAGAGSLKQIGTGTTTLTGPGTFTGATTVSAGRLVLGATASLGNTAITVAGGTLNPQPGSGTITIGSGGASLTVGAAGGFDMTDGSVGTVSLVDAPGATALTLGAGSGVAPTLTFELGQAATDKLNVTGNASVLATGASLNVTPLASDTSLTPGNYTLISAGGGLGSGFTLGSTNVSVNGTLYSLSLASSTATSEVLSVRQISGTLAQAYWSGSAGNAWNATTTAGTSFNTDDASGVPTGTLPDPTTNVVFTVGGGGQNLSTVLGQDFTINSLTFNGQAAGPVTIGGANTLTINALSTNGNTAGNGITLQPGSSAVTLSSNVGLNSAQTWTNNSANPLTVSGNIAGGVGLTQAGSGTLTLAGANTFSGGLTTGGGQLNVNAPAALGTGPFTVASAVTLDNTSGAPVAVSTGNPIALNGDVTFVGSGNLNLGAGAVTLGGNRNVTVNGGTLTFGGPVTDNGNNYGLTVAGAGTLALAGSLTGTLPLTVNGPGTVNLAGPASSVTGPVTLNGGTTNVTGAGGITGSVLQVGGESGNAVLNINTTGAVQFNVPDIGGVSGDNGTSPNASGAINQAAGTVIYSTGSTGYMALGAGATTTASGYGSYTISGGLLTAGPAANTPVASLTQAGIRVGAVGYGVFTQTGGTVNLGRYLAVGTNGVGVVTVTGGTMTMISAYEYRVGDTAGTGTFNLGTQAGGNGVVVSQSTQASGGFVVGATTGTVGVLNLNAGTLRETAGSITSRASGATGTVNFNGGTVQAGAAGLTLIDTTFNQAQHAALVYNGGAVFDTNGNAASVTANLQATAGLGFYPAGGSLSLPGGTGGAGYIGAPVVQVYGGSGNGATAIANVVNGVVTGVTLTSPGTGYQPGDQVTFAFDNFATSGSNGGATTAATDFTYTIAGSNDPNVANNGTGGLTKVGAGTLTVSGTNTYSGATRVTAGTLLANTPLAAGSATGTGPVIVSAGAVLAGTGDVAGPVTVNGTISAGLGASANSATGTLTTGAQTWNGSGGAYVAKVASIGQTAGANVNDTLVLSGLTVTGSGFAVNLLATNGSSPAFAASNATLTTTPAAGSYVVIATDTEAAATNPFATAVTLAALKLTLTSTGVVTASPGDSIQLADQADGSGFDLVAEDVAAATPEPTSLLLVAGAVLPLGLGRRRRPAARTGA
jgi:autotransporter-associated beta strand protein